MTWAKDGIVCVTIDKETGVVSLTFETPSETVPLMWFEDFGAFQGFVELLKAIVVAKAPPITPVPPIFEKAFNGNCNSAEREK